MRALVGLTLLALLASCQSAAKAGDHVWSVKAPPRVETDSTLRFTVETTNVGGERVRDVPFVWKVDWAGVKGTNHQGHSSEEQSIRVKGSPGPAKLRIFANNAHGELTEVATTSIEVVGYPPAR